MSIIAPSRTFENSELTQSSSYRYIKPDVNVLKITLKENKEGLYVFFLPSYKADMQGNGVWYKKFKIRRNFGDDKETYYVNSLSDDPAAYFERNFRKFYPEEAKPTDVNIDGKKFKAYPAYGNTVERVVFNVLDTGAQEKGAQVLELPAYNGASKLEKYHNTNDARGQQRRLVCDPEGATPVHIKLTDSTDPWSIQPDPSSIQKLPDEFNDTDFLNNLDEIFIVRDPEEILEKLQRAFHPTIFTQCMDGHPLVGSTKVAFASNPLAAVKPKPLLVTTPVAAPVEEPAAVSSIPALRPPPKINKAPAATTEGDDIPFSNPMAGKVSQADALAFLKRKTT